MTLISYIVPLSLIAASNGLQVDSKNVMTNRRLWTRKVLTSSSSMILTTSMIGTLFDNSAWSLTTEESNTYNNPDIPVAPEERSGLVVLRVAEVAQFQEKILRAVVNGDIDTVISPQQISFGTQILLKNSNVAGNMKLMIDNEIVPSRRKKARENAANVMNILQNITIFASKIQRPFEKEELLQIADMYRDARVNLNSLYEFLPPSGKDKYYGYFVKVSNNE